MPYDKSIKKVLVIGSGPIVIGQAAEFDYAGTQACRVLREEGIEIVLVNSNPATIMTDNAMADRIYIEPLTLATIKRIIKKERPDSILSGLGGQTGLTLCMQLAREGFLDDMNVKLLGSSPETIDKAEDREIFKNTMQKINQPVIPSVIATELSDALSFAEENGYPVIVRPAFTLGGSGGGIANDKKELKEIASIGIAASPIGQILVEKCVSGWKEIEFEVMRDRKGNVICVCSMENLDPVGVHTGDSIVIAPAVTLANKEYQMLRTAALSIIEELKIEGGCNVQFALDPDSFEYAVIEVNPRVSRSSALASKATGYPIAKVATKIAIGYALDEIINSITKKTYAAFEPSVDYVAVKFPKWPFDKFVYAKNELGTQMKATGEVMSIADTFELALLKAIKGAEIGLKDLNLPKLKKLSDEEIRKKIYKVTDERIFVLYEAILRGFSLDELFDITKVDRWFLNGLKNIAAGEVTYSTGIYKMVDTCAGEFSAETPYFYAVASGENEAAEFVKNSKKERVMVLGSGPIRIGQGIEFDYACVHSVKTLKAMGYEVIVVNNNPETVSTDFDTADRLYFEPVCFEDVMSIIKVEKPVGVVIAFGGGTAIKLAKKLTEAGVSIIGTSSETIDICEDRGRFDALLETLSIARPQGRSVFTAEEALQAAEELGYPVLMRPSYVLGGQNMIIAFNESDITEYMEIILRSKQENPVLIDKYLSGKEIEVDAICDGEEVLIPGIMEHIERTGIHSGDSIAIYPATNIFDSLAQKIFDITYKLCKALEVKGLVNIQYILLGEDIYVIEVNPRASRTVPYLSKVTGVNMCELATKVSCGIKLAELNYHGGIYKKPPYVAAKVPVFSFEKLIDVDTQLGPEMKSTGEVLGIGKNLKEALYKGLVAAGYKMRKTGGVFITVRDTDKHEIAEIAEKYSALGFDLYATHGTADVLIAAGLKCEKVNKIVESEENNAITLLESGKISYIVSTSKKGRDPAKDSVKVRRKACALGIPCLTSLDTAGAIADSLMSGYSETSTELVNINSMRREAMKINFVKMHGAGNDYIYIDCFDNELDCLESLAVNFSDRHFGIGGDGIVLILRSVVADAKMRMFNADGSEGKMCGNAIRCVAKYLYDTGIARKAEIKIETLSGIKTISVNVKNGVVYSAKVNMGAPVFETKKIPALFNGNIVVNEPLTVDNRSYNITCVSMGNPHAVVFVNDVEKLDLEKLGPKFENNPLFPEKINTEFVKVLDGKTLKMRVWEKGSGETLACGTGASACVAAAVLNGYVKKNEDIRVILLGGELIIRYTDEGLFMTGNCVKVFEGVAEL